MSTNYYWRYNICECCKRYDEVHIGRSSGGWSFSFHALESYSKVGEIKSYKAWLDFFKKQKGKGKMYDEYGRWVSMKKFKELVESKRDEKLNHTTYCLQSSDHATRAHAYENCFLDNEGHSFSCGEFS